MTCRPLIRGRPAFVDAWQTRSSRGCTSSAAVSPPTPTRHDTRRPPSPFVCPSLSSLFFGESPSARTRRRDEVAVPENGQPRLRALSCGKESDSPQSCRCAITARGIRCSCNCQTRRVLLPAATPIVWFSEHARRLARPNAARSRVLRLRLLPLSRLP